MAAEFYLSEEAAAPWVANVVAKVPGLQPVWDEHIATYGDEHLFHMFFGDISRWAEVEFTTDPKSKPLALLLSLLEKGPLARDAYIENLIWVSFVENIGSHELIHHLGPRLDTMAREMYPSQSSSEK